MTLSRTLLLMTLALTPAGADAQSSAPPQPEWEGVRAETLEHLQRMIRMDTQNPPGNEMQVGRYLESTLKAAGIETFLFEPAPGRASFVARIKGSGAKQPLIIMGHMDVVGVEREHWSVDPFGAVV